MSRTPRRDGVAPDSGDGANAVWLADSTLRHNVSLAKILAFFGGALRDGMSFPDAVREWKPRIDTAIPKGFAGYYIVRYDYDPIRNFKTRPDPSKGIRLGYYDVSRKVSR